MHDQYSQAFFTEEQDLASTLDTITSKDPFMDRLCKEWGVERASSRRFWDLEGGYNRHILNLPTDLFKYLYLFNELKDGKAIPPATGISITERNTVCWLIHTGRESS